MSRNAWLVTGGTGFLGSHVVPALQAAGCGVILLVPAWEQKVRSMVGRVPILIGDLAEGDVRLGAAEFDVVLHMAGLAHRTARREEDAALFHKVNAGGTYNLMRALERAKRVPKAFILVSTVAVYGLEAGELVTEDAQRAAADPYGASKREAEDAVMRWCAQFGVRCCILRLPLVAGRRPPGNLGAMVEALRRGRYFRIGNGEARRSMVWAEDVGRILPQAALVEGAYHLTDGWHPSFCELDAALAQAMGRRPPRSVPLAAAQLLARAADVAERLSKRSLPLDTLKLTKMVSTLTFSDQKARNTLGWSPSGVLDHAAEIVS
ncbi:MAG: NAD-dependent epimerase/dehydratase family protein [Chthonomonadales bacterium]